MPNQSLSPPPRRLVVRGVNWLGDAVMTTPALLRLREAHPAAHIALLTPAKLVDLWLHHPAIDELLPIERGEGVFQVARRLREKQFDTAVVFPNSPRSALEVFLARVPRRVAYRTAWRGGLLTHPVSVNPSTVRMRKRSAREVKDLAGSGAPRTAFPHTSHHIHHYLDLVAAVGARATVLAPMLRVTAAELAACAARLQWPGEERPLFGLNPGAEYGPAKRWPAEYFVEAAVQLHRKTQCRWLILGGPADRSIAATIATRVSDQMGGEGVLNLAGETTLREMCAALKSCALVLTNDTGPMHVAAALGTPVIVPFGSTSPELTGPGLPGGDAHALITGQAPCAPCFLRECPIDFRCMHSIRVETIVAAALDRWQQSSG